MMSAARSTQLAYLKPSQRWTSLLLERLLPGLHACPFWLISAKRAAHVLGMLKGSSLYSAESMEYLP